MGLFRKHKKTVTVSQNNKYLGFTPDELTVIEALCMKNKEELIQDLVEARDVEAATDINYIFDSVIAKLKAMPNEVYEKIEVMILG